MPQLTETYHTINIPVPFKELPEKRFLGMKTYDPEERFAHPLTEDLAQTVELACRALDANGYEVITITPITTGIIEIYPDAGGGHSYTVALLITAKRNEAIGAP